MTSDRPAIDPRDVLVNHGHVMADANIDGCLACDLSSGRQDLPGGQICATGYWAVEHCFGPFGVAFAERAQHLMAKTPAGIRNE